MSNYEVSNKEFNDFLASLKKSGNSVDYNIAKIDTNNWVTEFNEAYMAPFSKQYHTNEAYNNYPLVNITLEGAKLYCKWLTAELNSENQQANFKIAVRLPSRVQWLRASFANYKNAAYSWGSSYLRNDKGQFMCNFKNIGAENIYFNQETNSYHVKEKNISYVLDNALATAPIDSYFPNDFNLYNLNGNVAELVVDGITCGGSWNSTGYDVRNQSINDFEESSSTIGFRPLLLISSK